MIHYIGTHVSNFDEINKIKKLKNSRSKGKRQLCAQCVNGIIQDISRTLYNPKYSHHFHWGPSLSPVVSQISAEHIFQPPF